MNLPGFPLDVGGATQWPSISTLASDSPGLDAQAAVARLAQRCEEKLRNRLKRAQRAPEELATIVRDIAMSPDVRPYVTTVHAVRLIGSILEVEFSAAGFPGRYASYVGVDGAGGRYKLRSLGRLMPVVSSRCDWVRGREGAICVAEAFDERGEVQARVRVSLERRQRRGLVHYRGQGGIRPVEESAMRMARSIALGTEQSWGSES